MAKLEELVVKAEALGEGADKAATREACKAALRVAELEHTTPEWLAATAALLSRLGRAAYRADDPRTAHDAWEALHRHFEATLPDDATDLQVARSNLAATKHALGDPQSALALQEKVLAVLSRTLPDDHPNLQMARSNLAATKTTLGDLHGALALQEKVLAVLAQTLPDDHPDLQKQRLYVATTKQVLGDLQGARVLRETAFTVLSQTLPEDHPDLQVARMDLATTKHLLGDLQGALSLRKQALAALSRTLPDDHAHLQMARMALANTMQVLGDLRGALVLQENVLAALLRTLPDDHPSLQMARANLAVTKSKLGDLRGALVLQEKVLAVLSQTLPDDHPDRQMARANLAGTKNALGDLQGALALEELVFLVRSRTLPDDHPDLQMARANLAATKSALGDLPGALVLEEKVLAVLSQTLPDDHPDLQMARANLAATKNALGDLRGALALDEMVFLVRSRTLPDDHPDLQAARANLAATRLALGDLPGALALQEKALAVRSQILPDDHPSLQIARSNLAATKHNLGDLFGALALQERVLAVLSKTLPDDHPDLQIARSNLAGSKFDLGDLQGALALQEKVLAVLSKTLPDHHSNLQTARSNLAAIKSALGDLRGALALEEKVLPVLSRTLPDDHPDLQNARGNLAATKASLGDLPGALELQKQVLAVLLETLPDDHANLQEARNNLALVKSMLGDLPAAAQLHRASAAGALRRLSSRSVSMRGASELARDAVWPISHIQTLLDLGDRLPAETARELRHDGLQLLEASRSAELHTVRLRDVVRSQHPEAFADLAPKLADASRRLEEAIVLPAEGRKTPDGKAIARDDAIRDATFAKDQLERQLLALVPSSMRLAVTPAELAARLDEHEVAVSFVRYTRWTNDPDEPWIQSSEERYGAYVLASDGTIIWHSLAATNTIDDLIAALRSDAVAGHPLPARSPTEPTDVQPGRDPDAAASAPSQLAAHLSELRSRLFDPILAALPEGTTALTLSLADELQIAPLDELPLPSGKTLGDIFALRPVWALRVLLQERTAAPDTPTALVLGGPDYDAEPEFAAPVVLSAATPIVEPIAEASTSPDTTRSDPSTHPFAPLPGAKAEAERLAATFAKSFPDHAADTLLATEASEAAFVEDAKGKTYLHLATHGYFAPEQAWKAIDQHDPSPRARFDAGRENRTAQLSPYSLAGIALTGANRPADELGRREGIVTAQEIVQLDLQACRLATLSACKTSLGLRRAGTGLASLRQAFHAAGARFVLATLWEVQDAAAETLMTDFYTRLWQSGQDPHSALREAKAAARARGAAFRDWAGWVLSGR